MSGQNVDGDGYAIFVLTQFLPNGEVRTRDYAFTYDDCLARKEIELQVRPDAILACVVQHTPPPPPIQRDGVGGGVLLVIVAAAAWLAVHRGQPR